MLKKHFCGPGSVNSIMGVDSIQTLKNYIKVAGYLKQGCLPNDDRLLNPFEVIGNEKLTT